MMVGGFVSKNTFRIFPLRKDLNDSASQRLNGHAIERESSALILSHVLFYSLALS